MEICNNMTSLTDEELKNEVETLKCKYKDISNTIEDLKTEEDFRSIIQCKKEVIYRRIGYFLRSHFKINSELYCWFKKYHGKEYPEICNEIDLYSNAYNDIKDKRITTISLSESNKIIEIANKYEFRAGIESKDASISCIKCNKKKNIDNIYIYFVLDEWSSSYMDRGGSKDFKCHIFNDIDPVDVKKAQVVLYRDRVEKKMEELQNSIKEMTLLSDIKNVISEIERYENSINNSSSNHIPIQDFNVCLNCADKITINDVHKFLHSPYNSFHAKFFEIENIIYD